MKRNVNKVFDKNPSLNHELLFGFCQKYIENKKVLDIGCWSGQFEKLAIKDVKEITGIDPSKNAINYAQLQTPKAKFKVGVAQKLDFPDKSFDTVIFCEVIEHIPSGMEDKAIKEIYRVLKPNGSLILSTPNKNIISIISDPAFFLIAHRHYSSSYLTELLETNKFKILIKSKYGGFFFILNSNLELIYKHFFKVNFTKPKFFENKIRKEFKKGFAENILLAQKSS